MDTSSLPQVLTVQEVGKFLRVNKSRAYELVAQKNGIPSVRLGKNQIRIYRDTLLAWMAAGGMAQETGGQRASG